jgi:hypothetical protein
MLAELCGQLPDIQGADLARLTGTLAPDTGAADQALARLVGAIRERVSRETA